MRKKDYDFAGYATKNNLVCADGRIIRQDAFKDNDGQKVPMVWNHRHDDPEMVIGHAYLENRRDGVFAYCKFNDTQRGRTCKKLLENEDLRGVSIYANKLKQRGSEVLHGMIQELSLVLQPANPGALIDYSLSHSDDEDPGVLYAYMLYDTGELFHSDENYDDDQVEEEDEPVEDNQELQHADEEKPEKKEGEGSGKTVKEVFDTLNEEQKNAVYSIIAAAAEADDDDEDEDDEGDSKMKHNVFEGDGTQGNYLSHADEEQILEIAKREGSFRNVLNNYLEENELTLQHDAVSSGFVQPPTAGNVSLLFPEYKDVRSMPDLITNDQGWVSVVLNKVHKSPISRVRTSQVDIRNLDELRARGYQKGKQKAISGNISLARRTTDPQTVYVRSQLHRDDIIDITDFDYVQYLYNIDKLQLNEELATAIMLGDGRSDNSDDKIAPEHIRPIWTDDDLFTIHRDVDIAAARQAIQGTETASYFGDNYVYAEAMIEAALYVRETFKGSGTPDMFIHPHTLNVMLLARDRNGRRIFSGKSELASALNVGGIYTVEQFENKVRTDSDNAQHKLLAIMVNLNDYTLGATKGGEITHFTQFDIDFNLQKSLLETRCSGTLTRLWSAAVLEEPVA